jgi:TolB protein
MHFFKKHVMTAVKILSFLSLSLALGWASPQGNALLMAKNAKPLTINITKGVTVSIPIAVPGFEGGDDIAGIVSNDLLLSGIFEILPGQGTQSPRDMFINPELWPWQSYNGSVVATGIVTEESGELTISFRLFDVNTGKVLSDSKVTGSENRRRELAHQVSNAIYERLTGEKGYFDTQILYIAQYGRATQKTRRVAMVDCDGENARFLTDGSDTTTTPHASASRPLIAYSSCKNLRNTIRIMDLSNGGSHGIPMEGVLFSPRFSPDGSTLIFCRGNKGTTSIYLYDLNSSPTNPRVRRLTSSVGRIDVSPSQSPDGRCIVFASDRAGGSPKLYVLRQGETVPQLISKGGGSYFCPVFSPDGQWIAFIKRGPDGMHYLGIMDLEGNNERLIARDFVIDSPSWAPNGRVLVFAGQQRRFGPFSLYIVDFSGRSLRKLQTKIGDTLHEGNHPCWYLYGKMPR